ncbi:hypothetical protein Q3G72_016081 [Acer saccharum]|nr:hypothetical protein Q3G72_016081 [Acer saccharum]
MGSLVGYRLTFQPTSEELGNVVVCRMERKPNKKHHGSSSAVDEGQPSDNLSYDNTEDDIAEEFEPPPVHPAEWDELIDYNELISSGDSNVWITPLKSEQEDDYMNLEWELYSS